VSNLSDMKKNEKLILLPENWNNLKHFDEPYDVPPIPKVGEYEYKDFYIPRLIKAGGIPKKDLIHGQVYIGNHRNGTIAMWNQDLNKFEYWRTKCGSRFTDTCNHFEDDDGFALFVPIRLGTLEEYK
jgi:hypothetical protein